MARKLTKEQLLKVWERRLHRREKKLEKLLKAEKLRHKRIAKAEYQVLIAKHKINQLKKKLNNKKPKVRKPHVKVDRTRFGNVHGRVNPEIIVLHSTESHDRPGTGDVEGVLRYLEDTPESLGIHFVVDKEGNVGQGAKLHQLVFHARGANSRSVGIEQIGFAHHTHWNRADRTPQIEKVAKLLAYLSKELKIPLVHSTRSGVAKHSEIEGSDHTDPGDSYPMRRVLKLAKRYKKNGW